MAKRVADDQKNPENNEEYKWTQVISFICSLNLLQVLPLFTY